MATVALTSVRIDKDGDDEVFVAVATGNTYTVPNVRRMCLHFKKTGAGNATITMITPLTVQGEAVADPTITITATTGDTMVALGKFPDLFTDPATGLFSFTTDEGTGLTVAAIDLA